MDSARSRDAFLDLAFGSAGSGWGGGGAVASNNRGFDGDVSGADIFAPPSQEECQRLARAFERARGADGFVDAEEGRRQLQRAGVQDHQLVIIWDLSDLDRDRRLSLREFSCAMHLAEQVRRGRPLPVEVRPEQQEVVARGVERLVSSLPGHVPLGAVGAKAPRHEDFSTADTTGSGWRQVRDFESVGAETSVQGRDRRGLGLGFDSAGALGSQARAPPEEGILTNGDMHETSLPTSLGQLASVFEMVARLDPEGELRRLSQEVLGERQELEKQLSRRRDFERQLRQQRSRAEEVREQRRRVEVEMAATKRRITHLQDELGFVSSEIKAVQEDLEMLRETSGVFSEGRRGPAPYSSPEEERRDVLSKVRAERELLQRDQRAIEELRGKLEQVLLQKQDAQKVQQVLLEKQRQSEQDRGLMLTAIEAERSKLTALKVERLQLWEERAGLERDMRDMKQEQWLVAHQAPPSASRPSGPSGPSGPSASEPSASERRRGVRADELPPVVYGGFAAAPDEGSFPAMPSAFGRDFGLPSNGMSSAVEVDTPAFHFERVDGRRLDGRGIRNETLVTGGGRDRHQTSLASGIGGFGELGTRSNFSTTFGT